MPTTKSVRSSYISAVCRIRSGPMRTTGTFVSLAVPSIRCFRTLANNADIPSSTRKTCRIRKTHIDPCVRPMSECPTHDIVWQDLSLDAENNRQTARRHVSFCLCGVKKSVVRRDPDTDCVSSPFLLSKCRSFCTDLFLPTVKTKSKDPFAA